MKFSTDKLMEQQNARVLRKDIPKVEILELIKARIASCQALKNNAKGAIVTFIEQYGGNFFPYKAVTEQLGIISRSDEQITTLTDLYTHISALE